MHRIDESVYTQPDGRSVTFSPDNGVRGCVREPCVLFVIQQSRLRCTPSLSLLLSLLLLSFERNMDGEGVAEIAGVRGLVTVTRYSPKPVHLSSRYDRARTVATRWTMREPKPARTCCETPFRPSPKPTITHDRTRTSTYGAAAPPYTNREAKGKSKAAASAWLARLADTAIEKV